MDVQEFAEDLPLVFLPSHATSLAGGWRIGHSGLLLASRVAVIYRTERILEPEHFDLVAFPIRRRGRYLQLWLLDRVSLAGAVHALCNDYFLDCPEYISENDQQREEYITATSHNHYHRLDLITDLEHLETDPRTGAFQPQHLNPPIHQVYQVKDNPR